MGSGEKKRFLNPVFVKIDGRVIEVVGLADAGDLLLHSWPLDTTRRRDAMRAILKALRGEGDVDLARRAFIDAALEVFIFFAG